MLIRQEETAPVTDLFDKLRLRIAFHGIEEQATDSALDSELLKTYIEETIKLLKDFDKGVINIERDLEKKKNMAKFQERLHMNDNY